MPEDHAQGQTEAPAFHSLPARDVLQFLQTGDTGLSTQQARQRLAALGPNRLPEPPRPSRVLRFLAQFNNVLIYVLLVSIVITLAMEHWVDAGVIAAVVIVNAVIGFIQEGRAERAMAAIRGMLAPHARVIRDGQTQSIDAAALVPGDIVLIEAGDRVPADLRLLQAHGLKAEEAILTGESVPVDKKPDPVPREAPLGDRSSMLFSGTLVVAGTARAVVVATGANTEIGRISGMLGAIEPLTTPLVEQMNTFARWLTLFILLVAATLLAYGAFIKRMPFDELFMAIVGLSVAAIPEGLPAVLTITLAVGVQAMARRNAIVRRLPAIETLGAVSVICTDKTGTLTRNEMMAAAVATAQQMVQVEGEGYAPFGKILSDRGAADPENHPVLRDLALAAALCNDAALRRDGSKWRVVGDPMEGALLSLSCKIMATQQRPFADWNRTDAIPFDAQHRYMAVLCHGPDGQAGIFVKGAPEAVLAMARQQRNAQGGDSPLDTEYWHEKLAALAASGQRVLAIAMRQVPDDQQRLKPQDLDGRLVLIGLVGLMDPPRPEAIAAVAECHQAGIRVKMITGDHAETARAIARTIGLKNKDRVLTGSDLDQMGDAELALSVLDTDVFARTSPSQKLRLVIALQSHGLVVAMTGDGVNDAPALKRADTGIAMGVKGSEAAKEAADLVLADDNFATIAAAVREGRTVYDNIRKVIRFELPTSMGEAMTIVLALLAGMALPVTAVQILWINTITAVSLGLALAFEPPEPDTMRRPPRPRDAPLLSGGLVWNIVFVTLLFVVATFGIYFYAINKGHSVALAQTMALNTFAVLEIFNIFVIRNMHGSSLTWSMIKGTKVIWACVIGVVAAQFAITYIPALQQVFDTRSIPLVDGVVVLAIGVAFFGLAETEKRMRLARQ